MKLFSAIGMAVMIAAWAAAPSNAAQRKGVCHADALKFCGGSLGGGYASAKCITSHLNELEPKCRAKLEGKKP